MTFQTKAERNDNQKRNDPVTDILVASKSRLSFLSLSTLLCSYPTPLNSRNLKDYAEDTINKFTSGRKELGARNLYFLSGELSCLNIRIPYVHLDYS